MPPAADNALTILVSRSHAGDAEALTSLTEGLPEIVPWAELKELARQAKEAWIELGSGLAERARRRGAVEQRTAAFSRSGAGPLERLLAERAALAEAWLAEIQRLNEQAAAEKAERVVVRGLTCRVKRAERDLAAAKRTLRAFQQRLPPGP